MEWNPAWQEAIAAIESRGSGNYSAVTDSGGGNRAYGRYQIMDFNIPSWTERWLGQRMEPEEFLNNPAAQDAVFRGQFGSYVDRWGNPRDAASAWFTGQPLSSSSGRRDVLGTSTEEYMRRFDRELGLLGGAEVGPMRDNDLIANAGAAINRAEAPQPSGLGRLMSIFGGMDRPEPASASLSSMIEPSNLSRAQRRMLGFAALADAGAALSGREGGQFRAAVGQMQADQERERLRRQGLLQNLVALQEATASYRLMNLPIPDFLRRMEADIVSQIGGTGMAPSSQPAPTSGAIQAAGVSAAPVTESALMPATEAPQAAGLDALSIEELRQRAAAAGAQGNTAAVATIEAEIERRTAGAEAARQVEERVADIDYYSNIVEQVLNHPNLGNVVGRFVGAVPTSGYTASLTFDEKDQEVLGLLEQIEGQTFLEAYESLKGGGPITDIEGAQAKAAISRIKNRQVGEAGMRQALEELRQIYANVRARSLGQEVPFPNVGAPDQGRQAAPSAGTQSGTVGGLTFEEF